MGKNFKKIAGLVLAVIMLLGAFAPTTAAQAATPGTDFEGAVEILTEGQNFDYDPIIGINGIIDFLGEEDLYVFTAPITGTYEFVCSGTNLDPMAWLYDANGVEIGRDDDSAGNLMFYLPAELEEGQKYFLKIAAWCPGYTGFYAVRMICPSGYIIDDGGNAICSASEISISSVDIQGFVVESQYPGDVDYFKFTAPKSGQYTFSSYCSQKQIENGVDPSFNLYQGSKRIAWNSDKSEFDRNFELTTFLLEGEEYIFGIDTFMMPGMVPMTIEIK